MIKRCPHGWEPVTLCRLCAPKSAEEVAEEIVSDKSWKPNHCYSWTQLEKVITQALTAFAEEAVSNAINAIVLDAMDDPRSKEYYAKGFSEALEEAAKVCEANGKIHREEGGETTWAALAESYADMIRALKGDTGK